MEYSFVRGWGGIGQPPPSAQCQYAQLWHYEFVLRHVVYGAMRLKYGRDWNDRLDQVKIKEVPLSQVLKEEKNKSVRRGEFRESEIPNDIWFTTLGQLCQVIQNRNLWSECFASALSPATKGDIEKCTSLLIDSRNRWAHFRPLAESDASEKFLQFKSVLGQPLTAWMARYWNANLCDRDSEICKSVEAVIDPEVKLCQWWNGGGFLSDEIKRNLDRHGRGWALRLWETDAGDCYWVEPCALGLPDVYALEDVKQYAKQLKEKVVHVALVFDLTGRASGMESNGIQQIRISIPKSDGEEAIVRTIQAIWQTTEQRQLRMSDRSKHVPQEQVRLSDYVEWIFYNAPYNVIIAPTQERAMGFCVTVGD